MKIKNKNKLVIISLFLILIAMLLFFIWHPNITIANSVLEKLCSFTIKCSSEDPYDCAYPRHCVWIFIFTFPLFLGPLLFLISIITGYRSLKSGERAIILFAILLAIPFLLFYLWVFYYFIYKYFL